jgi:hypothetical protein
MKTIFAAIFICCIYSLAASEPALTQLISRGPQDGPAICYSPDKKYYIGWFDIDSPLPIKTIRPVILCYANSGKPEFSFVTGPGQSTQAAWNPDSTSCIIVDQYDNGSFVVWLVYKDQSDSWRSRELDPLSPVYAAHQLSINGKDTPLFRPALRSMKWTSPRDLVFCITSDHKIYEVYVDIGSKAPFWNITSKAEQGAAANP